MISHEPLRMVEHETNCGGMDEWHVARSNALCCLAVGGETLDSVLSHGDA